MNVQAAAKHHHTSTISYLTGGLWDYVFRAAPAPQTLAASSYSNNENRFVRHQLLCTMFV